MRSILILIVLLAAPVAAQDGHLSLNHLNRFYNDATESFDVRFDSDVLRALSSSRPAGGRDAAAFSAALGRLRAVTAKGFRFAGPGRFGDNDLDELRSQLSQPAWERVATIRQKGRESLEIYLVQRNGITVALTLLSVSPTEIYVANLVGDIDIIQFSSEEGLKGLASLDQNWERWLNKRGRSRWK
ncbi:MAG: hypothetical protein AB7H86_10940 [Blastocatellales bacterium]